MKSWPLSKKKLIGALVICAVISVAWLFRTSWKTDTHTTAADSGATQVIASGAISTRGAARVDAVEQSALQPPASAASGRSLSVDGSSSLKWKTLVGERNTDWAIRQLIVSSNPDDWYRAFALARVCVGTASIPEKMIDEAIKTTTVPPIRHAEISAVHAQARQQCGANDTNWLGNELLSGLILKAKQGGSTLANAPQISVKSLREGFSQTDADALTLLLKDEGLRSAWLLANGERLAGSIVDMPSNREMKTSEVVAAIFETMCRAGDECGAGSIYVPALCSASSYGMCSTGGVEQAIASTVNAENRLRVSAMTTRINDAMNKGDLSMFGLRIVK
jgi:hypothetical protein